mgnify:CR=1 FL=1
MFYDILVSLEFYRKYFLFHLTVLLFQNILSNSKNQEIEKAVDKTIKNIESSWLNQNRTTQLEISFIPPDVNDEDVLQARTNLAELAIASPIVLNFGDRKVEISPRVIGTALNFEEENNKLVSKFDENVIIQEISRQIPNIQSVATDARFEFIGNKVALIPAQEGLKFILICLKEA